MTDRSTAMRQDAAVAGPPRGAALAGAIAVGTGIAASEIIAALTRLVPSPLDAMGQVVVDRLPGPIVTGAIDVLGAANRLVLAGVSLLVALLLGAVLGRLGARSFPGAVGMIVVVGVAALVASLNRPEAAFPLVLLTLAAAGSLVAAVLFRLLGHLGADRGLSAPGAPTPTDPPVDRRAFLRLGVASTGLSVLAGGAARAGVAGPGIAPAPTGSAPAAARPLPPVPAGRDLATSVSGVSPVLTPIEEFFRIDTAVLLPRADVATWRLRVTGAVARELHLSYEELTSRDLVEVDATIACVSNEVGGSLIGTARWVGVPLAELLAEAGPTDGAEQVLSRSVDGFTAGFPLAFAQQNPDALVAVGMNGRILPLQHGYPARLVVPGLYGYVSATKWLADLELTAWEGVDGYWVPRGWSKRGPVKIGARIDVPRGDSEVAAGAAVVAGVAWAPGRGVERVEVVVDGEQVVEAALTTPLSSSTWVQWRASLSLDPGEHRVAVRAVDGDGVRQSQGPAPPAPNGAEGWHTIRLRAV